MFETLTAVELHRVGEKQDNIHRDETYYGLSLDNSLIRKISCLSIATILLSTTVGESLRNSIYSFPAICFYSLKLFSTHASFHFSREDSDEVCKSAG